MKHLFENNNGDWTKECDDYSKRVNAVLLPIFQKAMSDGHSLRDVHYIVQSTAYDAMLQVMYDCQC